MKKEVIIYTDGGCRGNGNEEAVGGYGAVLIYKDTIRTIKKGFNKTTNNIMELTAAIDALSLLKEPCKVKLYSDSAYLVNAFNNKWVQKWQINGWKTANKEPVKNKELWEKLIELSKIHDIEFIKVKGHADDELNNLCDKLANEAMDEAKKV
ncbi:Ribonuclease HI [Caloramator mitchellensis]|uniref:ribonuclease H n=1 Tax=Caloramator mitchellensis TaxID=908809 RepID=A0A0R3JX24_CALMK|nr:ribonuclease HI [Caloramator mitchellensis]KRQ88105.1 Ribonuclease HI [Caloramator mitchellensis]